MAWFYSRQSVPPYWAVLPQPESYLPRACPKTGAKIHASQVYFVLLYSRDTDRAAGRWQISCMDHSLIALVGVNFDKRAAQRVHCTHADMCKYLQKSRTRSRDKVEMRANTYRER